MYSISVANTGYHPQINEKIQLFFIIPLMAFQLIVASDNMEL